MKRTEKIILSIVFLLIVGIVRSQTPSILQRVDRVINLARFVDWSENNHFLDGEKCLYVITDYNIPLNTELESRTEIHYKNWKIVCQQQLGSVADGAVVYLTKEKDKYLNELIHLSDQRNILTISEEQDDFCQNGGMINLIQEENTTKFEINYKIIRSKSLNISSKVLALAKIYD